MVADRRLVCFDCDSTLSAIEGIDWLAGRAGRADEVVRLTAQTMAGAVPLEAVYEARLKAVNPTLADLAALAEAYADRAVEGASGTVAALSDLGFEVWVVSGGLADAVTPFAAGLGIPADRVRAVPVPWSDKDPFAAAGRHPLARSGGKARVVAEISAGAPVAMVGDGATDLDARPPARCVIGYGGVIARDVVRQRADAWIACPSLSPVAALVSPAPPARTTARARVLLADGWALIDAGHVRGGCPAAWDKAYSRP